MDLFRRKLPFFNSESQAVVTNDDLKWLVETLEEISNDISDERRKSDILSRLGHIKIKMTSRNEGNSQWKLKSKSTKVINTQLYIPKHKELCTDVLKAMQDRIKEYSIEMKTKYLDARNYDLPLIVMCLVKSRIGADVDDVIEPLISGETADMKAWVIIVHDLKEHALPSGKTESLLMDKKYKKLAGYIDVAYQSDQGLYLCEMNDNALNRIASIFKQDSKA